MVAKGEGPIDLMQLGQMQCGDAVSTRFRANQIERKKVADFEFERRRKSFWPNLSATSNIPSATMIQARNLFIFLNH